MVLIAEIEQGIEVSRRILDLGSLLPEELPERLVEEGVRVLVCGGIHPRFQALVEERGIELYGGLVGPADTALQFYREGRLETGQFLCPGGAGRGGGRGGGGGRRRRGRGR